MDEEVGVGVVPAERAQDAGAGRLTPGRRMSARRKQDAVLRLLRGEDLELLSRELKVTAAELSGWREAFLAAGEASLKSRPADARDAEIGRLKEKVGDLTIERSALDPCPQGPGPRGPGGANELLETKIERLVKISRLTR
jgi:transposase